MPPLRLTSMNHLSRVCENVARTKEFYENLLGFVEVRRPTQLEEDFEGSWLFNYGVGIHLIAGQPPNYSRDINPKDDHLSFQCESFSQIIDALEREEVPYKRTVVRHQNTYEIHQVFFHDPDHNMIEICTCECMPVTPVNSACGFVRKDSGSSEWCRRPSPTSSLDLTALDLPETDVAREATDHPPLVADPQQGDGGAAARPPPSFTV